MRRRLLLGLGIVLLIVSATLVIWQGSFNFGNYGPTSPQQTLLYWAVSTLVFLLTVTLGFILFRTGVKLYVERQSRREGSRLKIKLVTGALALSFMPVFFLVLWSFSVLNRNLDKWFSRPAEGVRVNLEEIARVLDREARERALTQAAWLAMSAELQRFLDSGVRTPSLDSLCQAREIASAAAVRATGERLPLCGDRLPVEAHAVRMPVTADGRLLGEVVVAARPRIEVAEKQRAIEQYIREYEELRTNRKSFRNFYLLLLTLLTLFILFVATWIALFLAKQISNPISALLDAAGEVRRGNLAHRIEVRAADELGTLVRAFNEMTRDLEANSRELERRRRFTEAILESIPTGVLSLSADGAIRRVNSALKLIFSEERVEQAARLEDLFSREDTAEIKYMMKRARRTGSAMRQLELKTGRGTLHLAATVCALEEKLTSGFVLVLEDTSELLRAQKSAAWHEVARRIAHEMKNPLTPISLCSERISRQLDRIAAPPEVERVLRECTATIASEVESVKTLVDEFAQFSRFPAAQPAPSDLNEVVENALSVFADRLDGIELHRDLAPNLPPVHIDREQFKRVVINLVDNAAESMQESLLKRLYVGTQAPAGDTVELVVADTGCGVSPEDKDRLFLPYFSTKGRGTGLGLAIVSHILAEHNATIRVEDNHPAGARFIVEIPAILAPEIEPRPAETSA